MSDPTPLLHKAWSRILAGVAPGRSPFSMIYLATVGAEGEARVRTVVIRRASEAPDWIGFNTDLRSPKAAELTKNPRVAILAYDMDAGEQIRLEGVATVHTGGAVHSDAWAGSASRSRICYRHAYAPGAPLERPEQGDPTAEMREPNDPDAGLENFGAVVLTVQSVDWLDLAAGGHRRARFSRTDGQWSGLWVAP